jgi:phosphoserine phosphatase RsbX
VGNVAGFLVPYGIPRPLERGRVAAALVLGGIVGFRLPVLHVPEPVATHPGDVLILATDGVKLDIGPGFRLSGPVGRLANELLERNATDADDALVLAARHRGGTTG